MINPLLVEQKLEENGFKVEYIYRKRTNMIDLHRFSINFNDDDKTEIVTVWNSAHMGNKLFIETKGGTKKLGKENTEILEKLIREAVCDSPNNKLSNLFDPIQFISHNFIEEEIVVINEERVQEQFEKATMELSLDHREDRLSYYGLTFPRNNKEGVISTLFEKLPIVNSVERKKSYHMVKFFSHSNSIKEEFKKMLETKKHLDKIGIKVEVKSVVGILLLLLVFNLHQILINNKIGKQSTDTSLTDSSKAIIDIFTPFI